ncbi:MAG: hypothetical protein KY432_00585 [Acidobacteria bacterium]|nr:hypothetical protein [Acidobacteriota bacterium]
MNCNEFRISLETGQDSPEAREHQRECASCLELAICREPSTMFSTLGGSDLLPPEGLDAFVSGVMTEVRLRETEKTLGTKDHPVKVAWWWAAAAAVFVMFTTWLGVQSQLSPEPVLHNNPASVVESTPRSEPLNPPSVTLPVIDHYDKAAATIVELPSDSIDDLKIVMIFDESLPQDL